MKYHPDVLAVHAEFGGDLQSMQALYDRPDHIARIAALEAQLAEMAIRIKPLEWKELSTGWIAHTSFHAYEVVKTDHGFMATYANRDFAWGTEDAMKVAAQADFDHRVLSALEATSPAQKVMEERTWGEIPNTRTDDAHPINVLAGILLCAERWVPEARIIGNVRAGDIARAIRAFEPSDLQSLSAAQEAGKT